MIAIPQEVMLPNFFQELCDDHLDLCDFCRLNGHAAEAEHDIFACTRNDERCESHKRAIMRRRVDRDPHRRVVIEFWFSKDWWQLSDRIKQVWRKIHRGLVLHDAVHLCSERVELPRWYQRLHFVEFKC